MNFFTRRVVSAPKLARSYAAKYKRPKPGTSERPPYRAGDPLVNNPDAHVTPLNDEGLTFIHRPPPTAPSPYSLSSAPTSPLLRPPTSANGPLPPSLKPTTAPPTHRVTEEQVAEMKQLRASDPHKYTRTVLARKFDVTPNFVSIVAAAKKSHRKSTRRALREEHEKNREKWSERHKIVKAVQAKRRELW